MQLSSYARKAVASGLAASTILWAAAGILPTITSAAVSSEGCVVLSGGVVWLITGGTRRGFTSAEVFQSSGYNFSQVVAASAEDVALPVGPIMTYADGTLVMGPNDPLVYLVTGGQKRGFTTASVFLGSGFSWSNIQVAPANTFADLPMGANLNSTTDAHGAGVLVVSNGTVWKMTATGRMGFPSIATFNSYGLLLSHVVSANAADLNMADQGAVSARPGCTGGGPTPPPPTGAVNASLASDNPASGTLVATQALADLAHFAFSGSGTVTALTFERIGVSANSTLSSVYLFDGSTRLTDSATVSADNKVTFAGLVLAVSGSRTIAVKADILTGTSGQTIGMRLVSFTVTGLPANVVSISGNIHTIASATLATLAMSSATGTGNTDPGNDISVWQGTATVATRDVTLTRLALRQIGSIVSSDVKNFRLQVDGTQVASTAALDANGYVTFTPNVVVKTGARTFKVIADIVGGSSRTIQMSLRGAYDISSTDSSYLVGVLATGTFPFGPAAATINAGSLTVAKATDSPSANLVAGASDVSVGKWTFTAYGETVKVETLSVGVDTDDTDSTVTFRNVRVMVDGSQVGSTTDVPAVAAYATGTSFTTNFYVVPGTPRTVEVRADMYDSEGTEEIGAGTLTNPQFALVVGSSNGTPQVSLTPINVPTASVPANSLTIATGTMSLAKTSNYPNQTIVVPQTAYKIGSFNLTGNATEAVNVNSFTLSMTVADTDVSGSLTVADVTDVYIKYGSTQTSVKATVAATGNTWSPSFTLAVNESIVIDVYGTLSSDFTSTDTVIASLLVAGTTAQSGAAANTNSNAVLAGQTITVSTGTITATLDASAAIAALVDDAGTVSTAAFKFASVTDSYTVTDITLSLGDASAVSSVTLKDGSTVVGASKPGATSLTWSGLSIVVNANTTKVITVELALTTVGVSAGTSDAALTTTLTAFTARSSAGTSDASANDAGPSIENNPAGNAMYVYKAVPLITSVALPNATLAATTKVIAKFTVSSNGTGTIAWKQVMLEISKTATPVLAAATLWNSDTGAQVTAASVFQNGTAGVATTCSSDNTFCEALLTVGTNADDDVVETVSGAKTYEIRSAITGSIAAADSVSVKLDRNSTTHTAKNVFTTMRNAGTAGSASFVWSDESASATSDTASTTWENDYLVKSLPIDIWGLD
ncbi:MAG: hypothetical protein Q7R60_00275 [bacterium]|nr:hypothetical protein [bacterium]